MAPTHDGGPQILVMDANERNAELLGSFLEAERYRPVVLTDLEMAEDALANVERYAFAIVDVDRFGGPVWSHCELFVEGDVPFVVLSGLRNRSLRRKSRVRGANAFVDKPIPKRHLRNLIESALETDG